MGRRIKIKESHLKFLLENLDRLDEQSVAEKEILKNLENDLNDLIESNAEAKYLSDIMVKVGGSSLKNLKLTIGKASIPFEVGGEGILYKEKVFAKQISTSEYLPQLEANAQYKLLMDGFPEVRDQIKNGVIKMNLKGVNGPSWVVKCTPVKKTGRKDIDVKLNEESDFSLYEFYSKNKLRTQNPQSPKNSRWEIETENLGYELTKLHLKFPYPDGEGSGDYEPYVPTEVPKPVDLGDLFGNNQFILNQDSDKFKEFVKVMKNYFHKGGKLEKLVITASASRVPATKDKVSGKDWRDHKDDPDPSGQNDPANYYLSKARAENARDVIVEQLKIPADKIEIKVLGAQGPEWKSGVDDANDEKYRKHRFVRVDVIAPK